MAALAVVLGLSVLGAAPASAHAALEETTPADGRKLGAAPSKVTFRFNESMLGFGVTVRIAGPGGDVTNGKATVKGRLVTQGLDAGLAAGTYKVQWRVASKDGHPISGTSSFSIAAAATPEPAPTTTSSVPTTAPATIAPTPVVATSAPTDDDGGGLSVLVVLGVGVGVLAVLVVLVLAYTRRGRP